MIFIFSQPHDTSTNLVIDWLYYYDQKTIRINSYSDFFHHFDLGMSLETFQEKQKENASSMRREKSFQKISSNPRRNLKRSEI